MLTGCSPMYKNWARPVCKLPAVQVTQSSLHTKPIRMVSREGRRTCTHCSPWGWNRTAWRPWLLGTSGCPSFPTSATPGVRHLSEKEGNVLFNGTLNTFYLRLYGIRHMVKDHSDRQEETCCCHIGYSFWLAARVHIYMKGNQPVSVGQWKLR